MNQAARLYQGCRDGDEAAWAELRAQIRVIVAARVRDPRIDVDDLVQAVVVWLLERDRLDRVSEPEAFVGFLWRAVPRKALELLGRKWTEAEARVAWRDDDRTDPMVRVAGRSREITLDRALSHKQALDAAWELLSETDRDTLRLYARYKRGEVDYAGMMEQTGLPRGSLAARFHRAEARFRGLLRERGMTI